MSCVYYNILYIIYYNDTAYIINVYLIDIKIEWLKHI